MSAHRIGHQAAVLIFGFAWFAETAAAQGSTERVSVDSSGVQGDHASSVFSISADGLIVAFASDADNLVAADTNNWSDTFVNDRSTGVTERVSVDSSGVQGNGPSGGWAISADGHVVAFGSYASNLVAGDTNGLLDVFVHDRMTGVTERICVDSSGVQSNGESYSTVLSTDGKLAAFTSAASNLVTGDTNGVPDVFLRDRASGTTELVSIDSSGAQGNALSWVIGISADGKLVAFVSDASNLVAGDTNGARDVFVHDRSTGITERVSVDSSGAQGNGESDLQVGIGLSPDGRFVAFESQADNLVANDTNGVEDVFVHDRSTGTTERISVDSSGAQADFGGDSASMSADGSVVAFESFATNLVAGDTNGNVDVFIHDRTTGNTERMSVDSSGAQVKDGGVYPFISADAHVVAFSSYDSTLVAGDTNNDQDAFVRERCGTPASWINYGAGFPGALGVPTLTARSNPVLGSPITVDVSNSYGNPTVGLLLVGYQRTSFHTRWGGDLLVLPSISLPVSLNSGGDSFAYTIPNDLSLCGFVVDLQCLEADPGAVHGVSFTAGLEFVLGE